MRRVGSNTASYWSLWVLNVSVALEICISLTAHLKARDINVYVHVRPHFIKKQWTELQLSCLLFKEIKVSTQNNNLHYAVVRLHSVRRLGHNEQDIKN